MRLSNTLVSTQYSWHQAMPLAVLTFRALCINQQNCRCLPCSEPARWHATSLTCCHLMQMQDSKRHIPNSRRAT